LTTLLFNFNAFERLNISTFGGLKKIDFSYNSPSIEEDIKQLKMLPNLMASEAVVIFAQQPHL